MSERRGHPKYFGPQLLTSHDARLDCRCQFHGSVRKLDAGHCDPFAAGLRADFTGQPEQSFAAVLLLPRDWLSVA